MKEDSYIGYVCKIDYDWHFEGDIYGVRIYPCIETLKEYRKCTDGCGIVKVRISLEEVIDKGRPYGKEKETD